MTQTVGGLRLGVRVRLKGGGQIGPAMGRNSGRNETFVWSARTGPHVEDDGSKKPSHF